MSTPDADTPSLSPPQPPQPPPAEPVLARQNRLHLSLVWIVPLVALIIGIVLVVRSVTQSGPEIVIEFRSAEGLEAGRTEVRYKEVMVGQVRRVKLSPDLKRVLVTVALDKSVARLAVEDTRFWVVRPRIGTGGVSGLATLLSGAYIGLDAGVSEAARSEFTGLDLPPLILRGEPGRSFVLRADDIGSLDVGSPVYHRRIRVGRVVGYTLQADGKSVLVQVFIEAPHERLVTTQSRFWNASGIDVSLGASGLTVNTQSIASVLAGGLAFAAPELAEPGTAAAQGQQFTLFATQRAALAPEDGEPLRVRMVFNQSLRGLEIGAPVELLGRVTSELVRVCRPGGRVIMANWTAEGFVGLLFKTMAKHVPPPAIMPSPLLWGNEDVVRKRFKDHADAIEFSKQSYPFFYPFSPGEVVEYFRAYYGPTNRAFATLDPEAQARLRADLTELWSNHNKGSAGTTQYTAEYLQVTVRPK